MCKWLNASQITDANGATVIVIRKGHSDSSSNPRRDCLTFLYSANTLAKGMNPTILPPVICK